jgi:hypothetical protein
LTSPSRTASDLSERIFFGRSRRPVVKGVAAHLRAA